jgi:hypothetical protein
MITAAAYILLDPARRSAYRDGVSTTSVVGRDVRVEYRTEPATDPVPPFRPRRPAAMGEAATGETTTHAAGAGAARPNVRVVWQEGDPPPRPRGWFEATAPADAATRPGAAPVGGGDDPFAPGAGFAPGPASAAGPASASGSASAAGTASAPAQWSGPDVVGPDGPPALPEPPPWSALAIVAALTVVTCTPVSLLLGVAALVQIRRTGRRGRALALFGTVVGAVFLVLYLLLVPSTMSSVTRTP